MTNIIVNEKELLFNRLEKEIYMAACKLGCEVLSNILENLDDKLTRERNKDEYRHKGKRKRTIKTLMGEVSYKRALFEHIDEEGRKTFVHLLDQQ